MKLGNAPCSWGVEFADDPRNPPWGKVLDECAAAGFNGVELGPIGFLPVDPATLRAELEARNLTLTAGFVFQPFHDSGAWDAVRDSHIRTCRSLASHDERTLVLIDSIAPERTRTLGRPSDAPKLSAEDWGAMVERIRECCRIAADHGVRPSLHGHAGGYIDFEDEIERVLSEVDSSELGICVDTAHLTLAGVDPLAFTARHAERLGHIHLKDIDPQKRRRVIDDRIEFYQACADNMFCEIGHGQVDFKALYGLLVKLGFEGWCTVEQDCAADAQVSKIEMASANRRYLEKVGF